MRIGACHSTTTCYLLPSLAGIGTPTGETNQRVVWQQRAQRWKLLPIEPSCYRQQFGVFLQESRHQYEGSSERFSRARRGGQHNSSDGVYRCPKAGEVSIRHKTNEIRTCENAGYPSFGRRFGSRFDNVEGGAEWVRDVRHARLPRTPFDYSNYSRGVVRHSMVSADLVSICPLDLQLVKALHSRVPTSSNQDLCRSNSRRFQISAFSKLHPSQYGRR